MSYSVWVGKKMVFEGMTINEARKMIKRINKNSR